MKTDRNTYLTLRWGIGIGVMAIAFVFCFRQTLAGLWQLWMRDGDYSYALAIPFITAYMLWLQRKRIAATPPAPAWFGAICMLIFLVVSLYGVLGSSPSAVRPAVPLTLLTIILFCLGWRQFRLIGFPAALLLFMIPLPTVFQTAIGVPLRSISTRLGVGMLRLFEVSVFVEGNIIDLGVTRLQVVDACSGLRYILPLLALGVIFARFFQKTRWKQIILVLATVPIAVLANGLRIGVTGYLAQNYGPGTANGFFHGFSGWMIFVFALALLIGLHLVLNALFHKPGKPKPWFDAMDRLDSKPHRRVYPAVGLSVLALSLVGAICHYTANLPPINLINGFNQFPLSIQNWQGRTETMDPVIIRQSGAEEALNATYSNADGALVSLYIGFRGSPFMESENFFHSPSVCMPSQGWRTLSSSEYKVTGVPEFESLSVRKMVIEKMGLKQLVYYWFQTKSHVSPSVHINRYHLARHALHRDNTYDLFIRPISPLQPGESIESAQKRLDRFVRAMMAELRPFLARQIRPAAVK